MKGPLAARQEALVRALVAGEPVPDGFDARLVGVAAHALLRKRAGEIVRAWPDLAGRAADVREWARGRPTLGSWRDGWEFARDHRASLSPPALEALAVCEARWVHGETPRARRGVAVRRLPGGVAVALFGRVRVYRRRRQAG